MDEFTLQPVCFLLTALLYRTNDDRAVACFLYKENEPISGQAMAEALAA